MHCTDFSIRTKATQICKNVLGPRYFENLIKQFKECKFSLIGDETIVVSSKEIPNLFCQLDFMILALKQIIYSYFILLEANNRSA